MALDTGPTPQIYQDLAYGYDLAGNIETVTDARIPANSETYGYDELHRLTAATGGWPRSIPISGRPASLCATTSSTSRIPGTVYLFSRFS